MTQSPTPGSLAGARTRADFEAILSNCAAMTAHAVETQNDELRDLASYISAAAKAMLESMSQSTTKINRSTFQARNEHHMAA